MNILYLKYALEVERAHSVNRAAENLYMGQPNLSRAIKELEESVGFSIFERTPRGMIATQHGAEFLRDAERLLQQIDAFEKHHRRDADDRLNFSVSVPRASYLSEAFMRFTASLDPNCPMELIFRETNAMRAVQNILDSGYHLGIVRYAAGYDRYFQEMFREKGLTGELVAEFSYRLLMSKEHPLAAKETILPEDLSPYTEIVHTDPFVPTVPPAAIMKEEFPENIRRRVFLFDRGSQFDMLANVPGTFMWAAPLPENLLKKNGLTQRTFCGPHRAYRDVLVYRKDYHLSELDSRFLTEVCMVKREYL